MDRPAVPAERGGRREKLRRGQREVHNDPVEGGEPEPGEVSGVREHRNDVRRPVERDVVDQEVDRGGVEVRGNDDSRPAGKGDGERPDAGEHIEHPLPLLHRLKDPLPLGGKPGREVGEGEVHVEGEPVLGHPGAGSRSAGEDGEPAGAVLTLDRACREEHRLQGRPGGEESPGGHRVVVLHDGNPAHEFVAGEFDAFRHDLELAPRGARDLFSHREEDGVPLGARPEVPVEKPPLKQPAPRLLGLSLRYRKAPLFFSHIDHQPSLDMRSHTYSWMSISGG